MEEYRLLTDGQEQKAGLTAMTGSSADRRPHAADLSAGLHAVCPRRTVGALTAAEFAHEVGFRKKGFSTVLLLLTEMGVVERVGKKGNAYLYRICY